MAELVEAVVSWQTLLAVLLVFGVAPGVVLRLIVLLYPKGHPRRNELVAELYVVPRWERPLFVAEQLEVGLTEALPLRVRVARSQRAELMRCLGNRDQLRLRRVRALMSTLLAHLALTGLFFATGVMGVESILGWVIVTGPGAAAVFTDRGIVHRRATIRTARQRVRDGSRQR